MEQSQQVKFSGVNKAIQDRLEFEKKLTEYTEALRKFKGDKGAEMFSELRGFPLDIVKQCGIFYIGEMTELLLPQYLDKVKDFGVISPTNNKPIFRNRYVIPILNEKGLVENLVGYSKESDERYIYGKALYYRRKDTLWGLENLNLAYEMGYAIVTEGITDAIRLRSIGYPNSFAMCGTHESEYSMRLLNRCRHGVIRIPDRDDPGLRALKGWEVNRHATLYVCAKYKDIDAMCSESQENVAWAKDYIDACIKWILTSEHKGRKCVCEKITML